MANEVPMLIRDATLKDARTIARNNVLLAKESECVVLSPRTALAGVRAVLSDDKKGFYILAESDGAIVGQLMVTFEWSDWRNRPIWWVQSVYVVPDWRKKGVFTKLFEEVKGRARRKKVGSLKLYVHTSNKRATRVYVRRGMRQEHYRIHGMKLK